MATNDALTAAEVVRRITALVRERLPASWTVVEKFKPKNGSLRPDLVIEIERPDGRPAQLVIEVKQTVERRDVLRMGDQARRLASGPKDVPVVAARYLAASVREALTEDGLSYVDATANMRIVIDSPAVFISERGEDRDPLAQGPSPRHAQGGAGSTGHPRAARLPSRLGCASSSPPPVPQVGRRTGCWIISSVKTWWSGTATATA